MSSRGEQLSRRRLLGGAAAALVAGVVSAVSTGLTDVSRAGAVSAGAAPQRGPLGAWPPDQRAAARATTAPRTGPSGTPPPAPPHGPGAGHVRATHPRPVRYEQPVYRLRDYVRLTPGAHHFPHGSVMLTIDDGPDPQWTPKILRLLEKHDVQATFCMIGSEVVGARHLARAVASQGHHLANHSFTHPLSLPMLPLHRIRRELDDTQDAVVRATGVRPHLFRSPGGNWGANLYHEIDIHGLVPLDWDIDPRDWALPGTSAIEQAMLAARPGDILLCHDGGGDRSETYQALRSVIPQLKARGLSFVTLPATSA